MMKRFKRGDVREDGLVFSQYDVTMPNGEYWVTPQKLKEIRLKARERKLDKTKHAKSILAVRKCSAKNRGIPFSVSIEYALSLLVDECPILKIKLDWGVTKGTQTDSSPSFDRIIPEQGYVEGNVQWVSSLANRMKSNATNKQLNDFADWVKSNNSRN